MALTFFCDFCPGTYPAIMDFRHFVYTEDGKEYKLETEKAACHKCTEVGEAARKEALEKRKQAKLQI